MEIVVIEDNISRNEPILIKLGMIYGEENIKLFPDSSEGLEYIKENLIKRMIVILDINFPDQEKDGQQVLLELREHNKLIPVIIWSARKSDEVDFTTLINNHAWYFVKKTDPYSEIITQVKAAEHKLNLDVATAIENWLEQQEDKDKAIIVSGNDKPLTANELINMIRLETPEGQQIEEDLLSLTVSLLFRGKKEI